MFCEYHWDRADEEATPTDVINESLAIKFIKQEEMCHLQVSTKRGEIETLASIMSFIYILPNCLMQLDAFIN